MSALDVGDSRVVVGSASPAPPMPTSSDFNVLVDCLSRDRGLLSLLLEPFDSAQPQLQVRVGACVTVALCSDWFGVCVAESIAGHRRYVCCSPDHL
jgi:hypothetical protein